jgi:ABC-type transport system involved in multi-copper enzyme maturation permease subunit
MVVEKEILPLTSWLFPGHLGYGALATYVVLALLVGVVFTLIGYLTVAMRHGPIEAFYITAKVIFDGAIELGRVRPGRLWGMTRLAFQEAIRRRVLVAFALFVLLLLFGGWLLNRGSDHPARLNISFVLGATTYLVLVMGLLLSAFSLPNDIRDRTIHTVVTKPVVAWEIVLGRILGFTLVGSIMLLAMAVLSYIFVIRGLSHGHTIDKEQLKAISSESGEVNREGLEGETSRHRRLRHRHPVTLDEEGQGYTEFVKDHHHPVVTTGSGDDLVYHVGPPEGWTQARVPIYGDLRFLDRKGRPGTGVSVGAEWTYRSFIEGRTGATAIWTFRGISEEMFQDGYLPVEMTIRLFRTWKGEIDRGLLGTIVVRNPRTGLACSPIPFTAKEFTVDQRLIPRQLKTLKGEKIDLFKDLVAGGEVEIHVQCEDRAQYFGMADADLYLRASDGWFWVNFFKGYLSIWFQMVLVICFGVLFSTLVSGPVAMVSTVASIVIGYFANFIVEMATGKMEGGGPLESAYRLFTQQNVMTDLDPGASTAVMQWTDAGLLVGMRIVSALLPNYSGFDTTTYVADGYYIQSALIGQHFLTTMGYVLAITIIGYFFLRTREIAA